MKWITSNSRWMSHFGYFLSLTWKKQIWWEPEADWTRISENMLIGCNDRPRIPLSRTVMNKKKTKIPFAYLWGDHQFQDWSSLNNWKETTACLICFQVWWYFSKFYGGQFAMYWKLSNRYGNIQPFKQHCIIYYSN